jgi:hypothetical protein
MKRSAQVALVLMGVTATTATAAYMMPARGDCRPQQPAPSSAASPSAALPPGVTPKAQSEPCGRRSSGHYYGSWGNWGWNSNRVASTGNPSSSVSTALTNTSTGGRVGAVSTSSSSSSSSSAARGGFGSTGHAMSGGSSGS